MSQITIRADADVIERVRAAAATSGRSMNEYVTQVLAAATNPEFASSDGERIRERLARAGLLAEPARPREGRRPSRAAALAAGRRAAAGKPVSDYVVEGR